MTQIAAMLKLMRSPQFAFGAAALLGISAVFLKDERLTLLGMAAVAVFWGVFDYIFAPKED